MNLLAAKLYDPGTAASVAVSALTAMTAFDTTNLRLTVTVPSHGYLKVCIEVPFTGATGVGTVLLGVMSGATVVARQVARIQCVAGSGSTNSYKQVFDATISGLTPGSITLDAAYAVQVVIASGVLKWGGPNNNSGANAWGGFKFEIWDPQPQTTTGQLSVDANGRVDVIKLAGTTQTARDLGLNITGDIYARLGAPAGASMSADIAAVKAVDDAIKAKTDNLPAAPASTTNIVGGTITTVTNLTNAPSAGDLTATMKASVTTACTASTPTVAAVTADVGITQAAADKVWASSASGLGVGAGTAAGHLLAAETSATSAYTTVSDSTYGNAQLVRAMYPSNKLTVDPHGGAGVSYASMALLAELLRRKFENRP